MYSCVTCFQVQQCVWRRHCGGGAVFSSPCLHPSLRQLYVASLGGHLLCLNPVSKRKSKNFNKLKLLSDESFSPSQDSGDVLWSYSRDVPFFSSPNVSSGRAVIGSVDGNICCFSDTGELVRSRALERRTSVFTSVSYHKDPNRGCLYRQTAA